jgi:hypothetical protein
MSSHVFRHVSKSGNLLRASPQIPQRRWQGWYAWFPVLPVDDGIFWLEPVWRRKTVKGLWEYRSLRPELMKEIEAAGREI